MATWAIIARLVKTKNLQGGLVAEAAPGLPFLLEEGMQVTFVPPVLVFPKTACIDELSMQGPDSALVHFTGVDSIDIAQDLVGRYLLVSTEDLPEDRALSTQPSLVGAEVSDTNLGYLGRVIEIEHQALQSLLVVDYQGSELRIPLVEAFLEDYNEARAQILVSIPESLIDLSYTPKGVDKA